MDTDASRSADNSNGDLNLRKLTGYVFENAENMANDNDKDAPVDDNKNTSVDDDKQNQSAAEQCFRSAINESDFIKSNFDVKQEIELTKLNKINEKEDKKTCLDIDILNDDLKKYAGAGSHFDFAFIGKKDRKIHLMSRSTGHITGKNRKTKKMTKRNVIVRELFGERFYKKQFSPPYDGGHFV